MKNAYFTVIFLLLRLPVFASEVSCLRSDWYQEEQKQDSAFFPCATFQADGTVRVLPAAAPALKMAFQKMRASKPGYSNKSKHLLGSIAQWPGEQQGAIFLKEDGTGFETLQVDNSADAFENGWVRYVSKRKVGFLDETGNITLPATFENMSPFQDGYATFHIGGREEKSGEHTLIKDAVYKFIDKKGHVVLKPVFSHFQLDTEILQTAGMKDPQCNEKCNSPLKRKKLFQACARGQKRACTQYGKFLAEMDLMGISIPPRKYAWDGIFSSDSFSWDNNAPSGSSVSATVFSKKHCQKGDSELCFVLGVLRHAQGQETEGKLLLRQACEKGVSASCTNYGYLMDLDFDHASAKKFYEMGCQGKDKAGCFNLATHMFREGKTEEAYQKTSLFCQEGFKPACNQASPEK